MEYHPDKSLECHPVISYLDNLWESITDKMEIYNIFEHSEVARWCDKYKELYPLGNMLMARVNLTSMIGQIPAENRWWLLALLFHAPEAGDEAGMLSCSSAILLITHTHDIGRSKFR